MSRGLLSICLLLLAPPAAAQEVRIVATSPQAKQARGGIHRAKHGETVTLYAVVDDEFVRPDTHPDIQLRWYKVEPKGDSYNNTAGGFHWDAIEYQEHPIGPWGKDCQIPADAHPVGYPDTHDGLGTMGFKVAAKIGDKVFSSPGKESIFRGGLSDEVIRVAFRRDDTFVGYLTELFNTPYIWGSAGYPPKNHQAERLIGSDCADFVVYGARRAGKNIPYRGSWHLPESAETIVKADRTDSQGRYLQNDGKPVKIGEAGVHIGDLLLFSGHVGALLEDRRPKGVLDTNDVMIHTFWAPPTEEPISKTAYADSAVRVLRWK
jgi:hypothetical protein